LEEITQEKEILESSVDPVEWKKECDRVKDQLSIKITSQQQLTAFELDAHEINTRRL
jgi:hypothetical protein